MFQNVFSSVADPYEKCRGASSNKYVDDQRKIRNEIANQFKSRFKKSKLADRTMREQRCCLRHESST